MRSWPAYGRRAATMPPRPHGVNCARLPARMTNGANALTAICCRPLLAKCEGGRMARIVMVKEGGELHGYSPTDERAYARFATLVDELPEGATLAFSYSEPRSPEFHRAHFALLKLVFNSQEVFDDQERLRVWLTCGAGHCDFVPGMSGDLIAVPRSIAYEALDETPFRQHH